MGALPGIKTGIGIGQKVQIGAHVNLSAEYKAILSKVTTKPSLPIQKAQNTFVKTLVDGGVMAKMACLIPYAWGMPNADDSLIWINNPNQKGSLSATPPTYDPLLGFTGNGVSAYINTTFNPVADGIGKYTQNDASAGWLFGNARTVGATTGCGLSNGNNGALIMPFYSANTGYFRINNAYNTFTSTFTNSLFTLIRKSSTTVNIGKDRVIGADITKTSTALDNDVSYSLAIRALGAGVLAGSYMTDTIALEFHGAQLTQSDLNIICDAWDQLTYDIQPINILMQDSCDGNVIDTNKWSVANLDPTAAVISQNNAIKIDTNGLPTSADYYRNIVSSAFNKHWGVWRFSVVCLAGTLNAYNIVGLKDTNTYSPSGSKIQLFANVPLDTRFQIKNGTTSVYDIAAFGDFAIVKMVVTPTHKIKLFKWVNDLWVQVGIDQNYNIGTLYLMMATRGSSVSLTSMRDVFITNKDYNTLEP